MGSQLRYGRVRPPEGNPFRISGIRAPLHHSWYPPVPRVPRPSFHGRGKVTPTPASSSSYERPTRDPQGDNGISRPRNHWSISSPVPGPSGSPANRVDVAWGVAPSEGVCNLWGGWCSWRLIPVVADHDDGTSWWSGPLQCSIVVAVRGVDGVPVGCQRCGVAAEALTSYRAFRSGLTRCWMVLGRDRVRGRSPNAASPMNQGRAHGIPSTYIQKHVTLWHHLSQPGPG